MRHPDVPKALPPGWQLVDVLDPEDPRLQPYRGLTDTDLRRRVEPEGGYFIAEGRLVIERSARAGLDVASVLTAPKWLPSLALSLADYAGPVLVASRDVIDAIAKVPTGSKGGHQNVPTEAVLIKSAKIKE